ncbi:pullulanase-type alpha-1,6-glucosidase [Brachybacterium huguangmaarense]|uniref:Pullulanase-type alpha-1,6-glucosidase n=1 Tax=Brachybacterium huguangmaarense TaxID=1652028 RepID=A0ABY6G0D1_9MICO|nr:pullulanase-type alpha-1,6-glucosidase [Brachybacterium huguangmaarense]UYG16129.1 pullulanase-type alpha-1,6-glucosidase [Brachybacterium huguangmaarense]
MSSLTVPAAAPNVRAAHSPSAQTSTRAQDALPLRLAHFLDAHTIALPPEHRNGAVAWELHGAPAGGMRLHRGAVNGGRLLAALVPDAAGLREEQLRVRRHLVDYDALHVRRDGVPLARATLETALTGQLLVIGRDGTGRIVSVLGLQTAGVLDDLYAERVLAHDDLGPRFTRGVPTLTVWAPTATAVRLVLFEDGDGEGAAELIAMTRRDDGCWQVTGTAAWRDRAYLFEVDVLDVDRIRPCTHRVTDPYSVGLTVDSEHSVLVDLCDPAWSDAQWASAPAPRCKRQAQQTIYELHIRDFSIADRTVPAADRGTYGAFTRTDSAGMRHLRSLADAGLTTVHLLPCFDVASIPERRSAQQEAHIPPGARPDSSTQQAAVAAVAAHDGYNWGYDPFHFLAPEGSYAREGRQSGGARTAEFRCMVGALHAAGLQVVLDQVFNHTDGAGHARTSVLDKVVPGYYHRLCREGRIETSTCCQNVATEHALAGKLMVDAVVLWARHYRVDGFRFDLMGHHSRENMLAVRAALDALTLERDGVDGRGVYLYGEGWNFGEVADNARFTQAVQSQLDGTGIGAFNDRLRDAVLGGGPMDADKRAEQGFATGCLLEPNGHQHGSEAEQRALLAHQSDLVRLSLAGNLRDLRLRGADGRTITGGELRYAGQAAGFATSPEESVNYVDAHDNETLYDTLVWKLPADISADDRVRMNVLALATTALGQSPSFWHAGTELLRSKSMDRDSFDSGDHFNAFDPTGARHGFGRGLPPAPSNQQSWHLMRPLLADPSLRMGPERIVGAAEMCRDLLRMRASTPLFTLGAAALVHAKVSFPFSGPDAVPGVIAMLIDDTRGPRIDPLLDAVLTVFNAGPRDVTLPLVSDMADGLELSEVQRRGADPVVKRAVCSEGEIRVPARTVAVFCRPARH